MKHYSRRPLNAKFVKGKLLNIELKRTSNKSKTEHKVENAFSSNKQKIKEFRIS